MKRIHRNFILLWSRDALYTATLTITSASVMQSLFLKLGMSAQTVSFYAAFTQAINLIFSLIFANVTGKYKNTKRATSGLFLAQAAATALFVSLCFLPDRPTPLLTALAFVFGAALNLINAVRVIFDYKLVCEAIDVAQYSLYASVGGVFSSMFGILPGLLLPYLYTDENYFSVTGGALTIAAAFTAVSGVLNAKLERRPTQSDAVPDDGAEKRTVTIGALIRTPYFKRLIAPNFFRGLGTGVISVIPLLAIRYAGFTNANTALIAGVSNAATFASCALYGWLRYRRVRAHLLALIGAVLFCALCFSMSGSILLFLTIYFFAYAGYNVIAYSIPDVVYNTVPEDIISAFHTLRMTITTLGTVISTMLIGLCLDRVDGRLLVLISVACMLYACAAYYKVQADAPRLS